MSWRLTNNDDIDDDPRTAYVGPPPIEVSWLSMGREWVVSGHSGFFHVTGFWMDRMGWSIPPWSLLSSILRRTLVERSISKTSDSCCVLIGNLWSTERSIPSGHQRLPWGALNMP